MKGRARSHMLLVSLCLLCAAGVPAWAGSEGSCHDDYREYRTLGGVLYKGVRVYRTELDELRPTQLSIGRRAVDKQAKDLKRLLSHPKKLEAKLMEEAFPAVIGPDKKLYIIDHHHHEQALEKLGIRHGYYTIKADFSGSGLTKEQFWEKMKENHWVRLHDEKGKGPLHPTELPESFGDLRDDPYRSLAGLIRDKGHFQKTTIPYAEFQWADFFRTRIPIGEGTRGFKRALEEAARISHSQEARDAGLPGFLEKRK